ncbi:MAG: hypothetical protein CEE42_00515 [Promethearchaeota archaeon Loki_b31]|nr:MAG: hypothetical protein CEE42_00515 [Candidatus Lokiarchaeota archaeon Loki_b31]
MKKYLSSKNKILYIIVILNISIVTSFFFFNQNNSLQNESNHGLSINLSQEDFTEEWFKESHETQLVINSDFDNDIGWISEYAGDISDVDTSIVGGEASFKVIGETYTSTLISGILNSTTSQDWYNSTNPEIPVYPTQGHGSDESGVFASHLWAEHEGTTVNAYQKTSIQWEKMITTPLNMSDYTITSASLNVLINATAKAYVGCGDGDVWHWEGVEVAGDAGMSTFVEGDYIKYYVRLANFDKDVKYKITHYQTSTLGQDGAQVADSYDYLNDTIFVAENMDDLIFFLNQVLENGDFQNFIIILGMEFNCEDNCITDLDEFNEVYIKACNLTISYVKKINQLTSLSWKYPTERINNKGGIIDITQSKLFFDYKIDKLWPVSLSPNSEFRILINDQEYSENIKLSEADTNLNPAKVGGFDLTSITPENYDINLTIQIFLADEFNLIENYTITIDNVSLHVYYDLFFPAQRDTTFLILLISALIASALLLVYFIYYRRVLRFPKPVRKVRKYSKSLRKEKTPNVTITTRKNLFNKKYSKMLKRTSTKTHASSSSKAKKVKSNLKKKVNKLKSTKKLVFLIFLLIGLIILPIIVIYIPNDSIYSRNLLKLSQESPTNTFIRKSVTQQWIDNTNFDSIENWTSLLEGDLSDIHAEINNGSANYIINGDVGSKTFIENGTSSGWIQIEDQDGLPLPDSYGMDESGWYTSHFWPDNAPQSLRVQWQKNFTMDVNMSDYVITSASLNCWINGTVQASPVNGGGIDRPGDTLSGGTTVQIATGDFARFFLIISDLNKNREFLATQYQTDDLGKDDPVPITQLNDTLIGPVNEETLIFYLEQALQYDHQNFAITLGTYIWCEDSGHPGDSDNWQMLLIKNFNMSISYEKKINQFSFLTWNNYGEKIEENNYTIEVTDAKLFFDYKINQTWVSSLSPNSRFKIFINNVEYNETIRLNELETTFKEAREDGFIVTNLIPNDDKINVSLQVYIADEFILDRDLMISIDNVILLITYDVIVPLEPNFMFLTFFILASIGAAIIATYIILYQLILKYPVEVRKVRKYRKTLTSKKEPDVRIINRKYAFNKIFQEEINKTTRFLKGSPLDGKNVRDKLLGKQQEIHIQK